MQRPMPPGPNGLRYLDYFLGLLGGPKLGTGPRLEVIAIISNFAIMYGAMQAASLPSRQARPGRRSRTPRWPRHSPGQRPLPQPRRSLQAGAGIVHAEENVISLAAWRAGAW
jgi:hypothetical protein